MQQNLRTAVKVDPFTAKIWRKDRILLLGSCFVDNLAPFFKSFYYQAEVNPLGVVFHPGVLRKIIQMEPTEFQPFTFEDGGVWKNYLLGAPFFARTEAELQNAIARAKQDTQSQLAVAEHTIITLGTAFYYVHEHKGLVGKCHKQHPHFFTKSLSNAQEITIELEWLLKLIWAINPSVRIMFTISPVRHTRDGLSENFVSKSALRIGLFQLMQQFPQVQYFPAYELMMDELRDYRFYGEDLVHPSKEAVRHIWDRFSSLLFPEKEVKTNFDLDKFKSSISHKPLADFGIEFEKWKSNTEKQRQDLEEVLRMELARPDFFLTKW